LRLFTRLMSAIMKAIIRIPNELFYGWIAMANKIASMGSEAREIIENGIAQMASYLVGEGAQGNPGEDVDTIDLEHYYQKKEWIREAVLSLARNQGNTVTLFSEAAGEEKAQIFMDMIELWMMNDMVVTTGTSGNWDD
jgi:hypothetical protein